MKPTGAKIERDNRSSIGLLANGVSPTWSIDVDEAIDEEQYFMQMEGPGVYLYFRLENLEVMAQFSKFLQSDRNQQCLVLGDFDGIPVHLRADTESARFFLVVGQGLAQFQITIAGDEVQHLRTAAAQVLEDLQET